MYPQNLPKILAIVAPTASGKSALAMRLARTLGAEIFSIDSLSVYREIDIASAKPTRQELSEITHHGINALSPDEHCSAAVFMELFTQALKQCSKEILLIVGGSGFYLTCLYEGLSPMPEIAKSLQDSIAKQIQSLSSPYEFLRSIDPASADSISSSDTYRIHKLLAIYFSTSTAPSSYFSTHARAALIPEPQIYSIAMPREQLIARIEQRTQDMLEHGLIDEARTLLERYGRAIQPFSAIGLKECLEYFDSNIDKRALQEQIAIHTRQLAKRQATYIRSKFPTTISAPSDNLYEIIMREHGGGL